MTRYALVMFTQIVRQSGTSHGRYRDAPTVDFGPVPAFRHRCSQISPTPKRCGNPRQASVPCPQVHAREDRTGQQVRIDIADTPPHQRLAFDQKQYLGVTRRRYARQRPKQTEHLSSPGQSAASELPDHEGMHTDLIGFEQCHQTGVSTRIMAYRSFRGVVARL